MNRCAHELIKDMVEHMNHLDKQRQRAIMDFMDYSFRLDKTREYIEELKEEAAQTTSSNRTLKIAATK